MKFEDKKEQKVDAEKRENAARSFPDVKPEPKAPEGSVAPASANADFKPAVETKEAPKRADEAEIANRRTQTQKESDVPNPDDDSISRRDAIESFRATTGEVPKSLQDAEDKAQAQKAE